MLFVRNARVDRKTVLRTPGQCHVLLSMGLLLLKFCWVRVNRVFWLAAYTSLTLRDTVTLRFDGGEPVRCCKANGHGSFVKWGRPLDTLEKYTSSTLRRFLPTASNVLGLDDKIAQAVGSRQDVPQGEGTSRRSIKLMSLHFSDEQAVSSGAAKKQVLDLFCNQIFAASKRPQQSQRDTGKGSLECASIDGASV